MGWSFDKAWHVQPSSPTCTLFHYGGHQALGFLALNLDNANEKIQLLKSISYRNIECVKSTILIAAILILCWIFEP